MEEVLNCAYRGNPSLIGLSCHLYGCNRTIFFL